MKIVLWILLILAVSYGVFILAPAVVFFRVIFTRRKPVEMHAPNTTHPYFAPYARRMVRANDFLQRQPCRPLHLTGFDGAALRGVFYDAGSQKTAVFVHGYNASPVNNFCWQAALLFQNGFNVVYVYQRAHGGSGGVSALGLTEQQDLLDWLALLAAQTQTRQVLLYGTSMGCTTVAYAAPRLDSALVKGMVLDCGYTSPYAQLQREMARRHLPKALIGPLLTGLARLFLKLDIKQSATDALRHAAVPALFFHGGADRTVPIAQGRENYEACASPKRWFSVPDGHHTLCYPAGGEAAQKELLDFIHTYFS